MKLKTTNLFTQQVEDVGLVEHLFRIEDLKADKPRSID